MSKTFWNILRLGIYLVKQLSFEYHIKDKMSKTMKETGILKKQRNVFPRHSHLQGLVLVMVMWSITNQIRNCFGQQIKSIHYNASFALLVLLKVHPNLNHSMKCLKSLTFQRLFPKL